MRKSKTLIISLIALVLACMLVGLWQFHWPGLISGLLFAFALALFGASVAIQSRNTQFRDIALRYHAVFESNIVGLVSIESSGEIRRANDYFLNIIGYTREEFESANLTWQELTPPEWSARSLQAKNECIQNGSAQPFEKEYLRKDGTRIPVLVGLVLVKPGSIVTFVLDISERKTQEQLIEQTRANLEVMVDERTAEIRESRTFLDSVIENIPNMIFVKNAEDLRFVRFNRAGGELVGRTPEDLIGKNDYDFFPKDQADFFTSKDRSVLEGRAVVDIPEEPISTPRGTRILHTKKIPVMDADGKPLYLLGISEDITEKKAAEAAQISLLREQAARIEAERSAQQLRFFGHASAALSESLDLDSMLTAFSRVVLSKLASYVRIDLVRDEAMGMKQIALPAQALPPSRFDQLMRSSLAHGRTELLTESDDSMATVPLQSHGKTLGAFGLLSKQPGIVYGDYEISLIKDLAKRAAFAVENAMLFIKAQEANRAKSAFLANMSHEIRTPLGAMLGFADLLSEAPNLQSEYAEYVTTILRNGRQLLRIVDEILDLSKVESEHMEVERIPFSLCKLLDEIVALLEIRAKEKNLSLTVKADPDLPETIVTDPTRLRQILLNVVGNAIKFTSEGFVEVQVGLKKRSGKRPLLEIVVLDSGIGITPEQQARLFQPFAQADDSMTRKFGGTGLGLVLGQKLARLLGGDLSLLESVPGRGSRFLIAVEVETPSGARASVMPSESSKTRPNLSSAHAGRRKRLLVVDDSDDNRLLVLHHIKRMGFPVDVDFAENGAEGVAKALAGEYDLVLMDIQMPSMDGFEAVHALRQKGFADPVIALTAHAMKGYRERCIDAGFNDYICKPIQKEILFQTLVDYGMGPVPEKPASRSAPSS